MGVMVAQISKPGGDFEIVQREIPEPGAGQVRIRVQACARLDLPDWLCASHVQAWEVKAVEP